MLSYATSNLKRFKLGDHLKVLTDYHANGSYEILKKNVTLLDKPDYAIMIRTKNFEAEKFHADLKYIDEHAYNFLSKSKVMPGDIIMNKIANAGSVYKMPDLGTPVSLAMNLFLLRVDDSNLDARYAYYLLKNNESYIKTFANGTATKTITKDAVRNLELLAPPLSAQRKIGELLDNLERRILANDQSIVALHKLGESIYTFLFQDSANCPLVKSPYCKLITANVGKYDGAKRYYATADIDALSVTKPGVDYSYSNRPSRAQKEPRPNSVWFARMKDSFKIIFFHVGNKHLADKIILSSGFAGFEALSDLFFPFVFFGISSKAFDVQKNRFATGATQVSLTNNGLANIMISNPNEADVLRFGRITSPIIQKIIVIQTQNELLRKERDLLLGELIPVQGLENES